MPITPKYSLPFEHSTDDEPGHTLDGGDLGTEDILAEKVEEELERIDGAAQDIDDRVTAVEERVFLLDQVTLDGEVGNGTSLVIPTSVRGEFWSYTLRIRASVGEENWPLIVRPNGVGDSEHRAGAIAFDPSDGSIARSDMDDDTSFPRTGYLGEFNPSIMIIEFQVESLGDIDDITWVGRGFANNGSSGSAIVTSGGRWVGSSQELAEFTVRTSSTDDEWTPVSTASLWGHV